MADTRVKAPWHLWAVGIIAVLFNTIGVFDFVMAMTKGADYMADAGMTPAQIAHYRDMPRWATAVWGVGVFAAFLASILLLSRSRLAFPAFVLSLAAFAINLVYNYILADGALVMGRAMAATDAIIAALLVLFAWYARSLGSQRILR